MWKVINNQLRLFEQFHKHSLSDIANIIQTGYRQNWGSGKGKDQLNQVEGIEVQALLARTDIQDGE